jgi:uncharacterized protein with von Willebrand factor type A (vWA) domain
LIGTIKVSDPVISDWPREALLNRLARFGRALRDAGVDAGPARLVDLARSFEVIDIADRADFYAAARAIYVSRQDDITVFDRVFSEYWTLVLPASDTGAGAGEDGDGGNGVSRRRELETMGADTQDETGADERPVPTAYSADELLMTRDLGLMSDAEIERARDVISELVAVLATVRGHRTKASTKGSRLDLRRFMRKNLLYGHDGVDLVYQRRKIKKLKLVLLCDVSGSMARYSAFLIQFIYALRRELPAVEVGVFSTRMTVITDLLHDRHVDASLQRVAETARDWGGGTDIGRCLREFNERFAGEMLRSKTVMVILSDGWDRGDAAVMRDELERLHRRVHRLIWLNPLLGATGYEPLCRGIRTALPFMDHFLPAHNLESLAQLAKTLRALWH